MGAVRRAVFVRSVPLAHGSCRTLLDAWAPCAARSPSRAPPSHFRARSCARVHLLDAWALCAARSLSELYLGHTGRAEPCSTRGRCAPRAPPCVHRPVSFVLGVVLRVLAKACGSVIAMVSVAEITSKRGRSGDHDLRRPEQVPLWRGKSTSERPPCGLTPAKLLACSSPLPLIISISGSNSWSSVPHAPSEPARAVLALARADPRRPIPRRSAHQLTMPARLG